MEEVQNINVVNAINKLLGITFATELNELLGEGKGQQMQLVYYVYRCIDRAKKIAMTRLADENITINTYGTKLYLEYHRPKTVEVFKEIINEEIIPLLKDYTNEYVTKIYKRFKELTFPFILKDRPEDKVFIDVFNDSFDGALIMYVDLKSINI